MNARPGQGPRLGQLAQSVCRGVLGLTLVALGALALLGTTHAAPAAQPRPASTYLPIPDDFPPELGTGWQATELRSVVFDAWRRYESDSGVVVEYRVHVDDHERPAQAWAIGLMNDLISQEGWVFRPDPAFGQEGFYGERTLEDGRGAGMAIFRVGDVSASAMLARPGGVTHDELMALASAVEWRAQDDPEGEPDPNKPPDPTPVPVDPASTASSAPPANPPLREVTDTGVGDATAGGLILRVAGGERGWAPDAGVAPPRPGNEYLAIDVVIDTLADSAQTFNQTEFRVVDVDGRRYTPVAGRLPPLGTGQIRPGQPARGWLTFEVPIGVPLDSLLWDPPFADSATTPLTP